MPTFPRPESEIIELANQMIAGYTENPSIFPNADVAGLTAARDTFVASSEAHTKAQALAKLATKTKEGDRVELTGFMKRQLRQSEVDTASNPTQLSIIGWSPKDPPTPQPVPGEPRLFVCTKQGKGTVAFDWKTPSHEEGGPVRSYLVKRRDADANGAFGDWNQVGACTETKISLQDQPRGILLEYHVVGINPAGEGDPSVAQAVVL